MFVVYATDFAGSSLDVETSPGPYRYPAYIGTGMLTTRHHCLDHVSGLEAEDRSTLFGGLPREPKPISPSYLAAAVTSSFNQQRFQLWADQNCFTGFANTGCVDPVLLGVALDRAVKLGSST